MEREREFVSEVCRQVLRSPGNPPQAWLGRPAELRRKTRAQFTVSSDFPLMFSLRTFKSGTAMTVITIQDRLSGSTARIAPELGLK